MTNIKLIAKNPTAYHNYEILEKIECRYCFKWYRNKIYKTWKSKFKRFFCSNKKWRMFCYWYAY